MKKICKTCKNYLCRGWIPSIDCLNDQISQEEYERCLGQNGEDCIGWKVREDMDE